MKCRFLESKKLYYLINNIEYIFIPVINKDLDNGLNIYDSYIYEELPNIIYGKIFDNFVGYNPNGWWKYLNVEKSKLLYK